MSPRPDVSDERKNQILEAATTVFSRQGFHKARMDDIVEESGLSKGTLYWYFKSKDDIIIGILDNIFQHELSDLESINLDESSATEILQTFMVGTVTDIKKMIRLMPLTYEFYSLAFRKKSVRKVLKNYFRKYIDILAPVIQHGIDEGEFRPVDAVDAAIALGAIVEGTMLLWVYDPEAVDLERHPQTGLQILLEGLQNPVYTGLGSQFESQD